MLDTDWMTNGSAGLWRLDNTLFANNISDWINDDDIFSRAAAAPTPEPATMAIFGAALLGLAGIRRRKR
jgi:hypothetical protein